MPEGEKRVELGWPHTEEDSIIGHYAGVEDVTGLTGSVDTLQRRLASQGDEIKALQSDLDFYRNWQLALWLVVTVLTTVVIVMVVNHGG